MITMQLDKMLNQCPSSYIDSLQIQPWGSICNMHIGLAIVITIVITTKSKVGGNHV